MPARQALESQARPYAGDPDTVEECVESFKRIGGIRVLVHEPGHGVDGLRQPGSARETECTIVRQVERASPDAEGVVKEICSGAGQRIDVDVIADVEETGDHFVPATLEFLVPVERVQPPAFIVVGNV